MKAGTDETVLFIFVGFVQMCLVLDFFTNICYHTQGCLLAAFQAAYLYAFDTFITRRKRYYE